MEKLGAELKVGDVIEVWGSRRDAITKLSPYVGKLASLFPHGAQIAEFAAFKLGMTIDNEELYEVFNPREEQRAARFDALNEVSYPGREKTCAT